MFTKKKTFFLVLIVIFLIFLELFLRFYFGFCDNLLFRTDEHYEYIMQPSQNRYRFRNKLITNTFSMRSDNIKPAAKKILGFGDSVLNGGVLTSHNELSTTILSEKLSDYYKTEIQFLNISSPSWGPDNCYAYLQKHGNFDATHMVLFVNSHDAYDNISFHPVVDVHPSFPSKNYKIALVELMHRYAWPRFISLLKGEKYSHAQYETEPKGTTFNNGFLDLHTFTVAYNIPFVIYMHPDLSEIENKMYNANSQLIIDFANTNNIPLIKALEKGLTKAHYHDKMHLNVEGQNKMASIVLDYFKSHK